MTVTTLPPTSQGPGPGRPGRRLDVAPEEGTRESYDGPPARPCLPMPPPRRSRGGQPQLTGVGPRVTPPFARRPRRPRRPAGARWEVVASPSRSVGAVHLGRPPALEPAGSPGPGSGRERAHRLRLTVRGRVVVGVVLATLLLVAFSWGRAIGAAAHSSASTSSLVVQPGQTLWEIAGLVAPKADRRATMATLVRLNSGLGAEIRPGQSLRVP